MEISNRHKRKWQDIVNLMAELIGVPAGLIMRFDHDDLEVFISSHSEGNPYEVGERATMNGSGLYCETVIKTNEVLKVPNSLTDEYWKNNPDVKLNMISYLGYPILFPDNTPFGTICVLDNKENNYSETYEKLVINFRDLIEMELALLDSNIKLKKSDKNLQDAQNYAHIGYWELLRDSTIATWSEQMYRIFGLPPEEKPSPETLCNILHASDCKNFMASLQHSFATSEEHHIEYRITRRNDGEERWIECRGSPVTDNNGEVERISGFIQDITERKLVEEAIHTSRKHFQTIFEEAPLGIAVVDSLTGHIYDANPAYSKIVDRSIDELRTLDWMTITHSDDVQEDIDNMTQMNAGETSGFTMQKRLIQPDGSVRWINMTIAPMPVEDKSKPRHLCMMEDITQNKKVAIDLQRSEQVLRLLAEHGAGDSDNILTLIVQQLAISQNVRYALIAQIDPKDTSQVNTLAVWSGDKIIDNFSYSLGGTPCSNLINNNDACFYSSDIQHLFPEDHLLKDMDAESYIGVPLKGDSGHVLGIIALLDDKPMIENSQTINLLNSLSARASIELERIESSKKLTLSSRVFNETNEGITITNAQKEIIDVNPAFCEITGYSREEVMGKNPRILSSGKQSPQFYTDMWQSIDEYGHWQGEVWNRTKSGELYAELLNISTVLDDDENILNYVGVFTDVTHSKHQQEELSRMAHYDVLTQLPNRTLFSDRFHQAAAHSKRSGNQLAVCFLDLDKFKPVNDSYGHTVGDQLLKEVAVRIKDCIREEDTVSRQGGDEFALLLGEIESFNHCEQFLDRLLDTIAQPYLIDGVSHKISASCGITLYPFDDADLDTLLRHADHAMYQAKQAGRNRHRLFSVEDDVFLSQKQQRLHDIEHALINNEFSLYYQPKVHMLTGEVFGAEALIRWIHPEKGLIPPLDFLPAIEDTELDLRIGDWVINQALTQLDDWNSNGIKLEVSINISSHHLQSELFYSQLDKALAEHPSVDSKSLQLEILESSALGDLDAISGIIKTCQEALGVNIALDDFGTGYSSLTHLRNLSANTIKIDQSFVRDMLDDPSDYAIIEGVIGLANAFNREIIAEGVETTEHGLMLLMMGCEDAQGYGIAKPMPAKDVSDWLSNYQPNNEWRLFGNKHSTARENKLTLFQLITERWLNRFTANITLQPQNVTPWPNISDKRGHCGQWIKREKQDTLFDTEVLLELEQAHKDFHIMAQSLQLKYQNGEIESARAGLTELQSAFDKMSTVLRLCH